MSYLMPNIPAYGISDASEINTMPYEDTSHATGGNAIYLKFDQRAFTTPEEFAASNMGPWGWLYIPKQCADGTNTQCHLTIWLHGCGGDGSGGMSQFLGIGQFAF